MNLIVHQMVQLQIMHVTNRNWTVKIFPCTPVPQAHLSVTVNLNPLPQLPVFQMRSQIIHDLRLYRILIFLRKFFPGAVDIIIGNAQGIHNIHLICTVKHRGGNIKAQSPGCKAQMNLQHLSDIHTGRHTQRIQHNIQWTPVGQKRHILHRQHSGNHTLVAMSSCHLVSHGDLTLLSNIDPNRLINSRRQLIPVLPGKHLSIHNNSISPMRHL